MHRERMRERERGRREGWRERGGRQGWSERWGGVRQREKSVHLLISKQTYKRKHK